MKVADVEGSAAGLASGLAVTATAALRMVMLMVESFILPVSEIVCRLRNYNEC